MRMAIAGGARKEVSPLREFKDFRRSEDSAEAGRRILMIFVLRPVSYSYSVRSRLGHVYMVTIHPA
jgi:hypothetical protein